MTKDRSGHLPYCSMMDFTQIGVNWVIEAILQKWVPYSQRYLVLGLVGLVGLAYG